MSPFWKRRETELEREVAHHLHELAAQLERQGHSRAEAMCLAQREFGGATQVKELCREQRRWAWMAGLQQDVTFGLRLMRRSPVLTAAAVLSLALGIGANTAIVSLMDTVLWRDLPVPHPRQLSLIHWEGHGFPRELAEGASGSMMKSGGWDVADFFSYPAFRQMQHGVLRLASVAAFIGPQQVSVSFAGRPTVAMERGISGNFFSTLQVQPQLGRLLADRDDTDDAPATVVLSHRFWSGALASDPGAVGRTLSINNAAYQIAGVLPARFYGISPGDPAELYTTLHHANGLQAESRAEFQNSRYWGFQMLARRSATVNEARLQPALDAVFRGSWTRVPKDIAAAPHIRLESGARGLGMLRQDLRDPLLVLGCLVGLLLLIASVNIANLLLARAVSRQGEIAMRLSLGCSRPRLMRQFLTESALLALFGGAGSMVVAWLTSTLLGRFLEGRETVPVAFVLDARTLGVVAFSTLTALLVFGLFPAWQASRQLNATWLKQGSVGARARNGWRSGRAFVGLQMALSTILVMAAVMFTRNLAGIESRDTGFDRRNLILFDTRPGTSGYDKSRLAQFYFNLEQRLRSTPGVAGVGLAAMRPMNIGGWWDSVRRKGEEKTYNVSVNGVTPSYLQLYAPRMIAGRNFVPGDMISAPAVAIVSEDLARQLGGDSVLGTRLEMPDGPPGAKFPEYEIVGIAPAMAATSIKERPLVLWLPFAGDRPEATVLLRTTRSPRAVLPAIRRAMADVDRNLPMVDTVTMEEQISKGLLRERMFATLCNGFGILALILSAVGLYGVISYATSQRRSEIGLRLALGALPKNVALLILRDGLSMAAGGILLGIPTVWLGSKYLQKELTNLKPMDPGSLVLTMAILLAAACAAAGLPALRASTLDPAQTLRRE